MKLTCTIWNADKAYFFRGGNYTRYNAQKDAADPGYSWPIQGNWHGMPGSFINYFDAIVRWHTGYLYFFKGQSYVKYNMDPNNDGAVPGYPRLIADNWKTLPKSVDPKLDFTRDLDSVVAWDLNPAALTSPTGYAYFFKGANYVKYNMDPNNEGVLPNYPRSITANWKLPQSPDPALDFTRDLDAVVPWLNGYAYFFKGANYVKYNMDPNNEGAMPNYPRRIYNNWPHLMASFPDVLSENVLITPTQYYENTCRAIPPSKAQPSGKIFVSSGQLGGGFQNHVLGRSLFTAAGQVDYNAVTVENQVPYTNSLGGHTDNHVTRLKNGDIIEMRTAVDWTTVPNPAVWQQYLTLCRDGIARPAVRGSLAIGAITPPSGWTLRSVVDLYALAGGKYAYPVPVDCNQQRVDSLANQCTDPAKPKWGVGGLDRPELYACPFTGNVYITFAYFSGPYMDPNVPLTKLGRNMLLICSRDNCQTWEVVKDDFAYGRAPIVMTSTPNGRLFLYQWTHTGARVYFSNLFAPQDLPVIYGGESDLQIVEKVNGVDQALQCQFDNFFPAKFQINHPAISRISRDHSDSKVRTSYTVLNSQMRQEVKIVNLEVIDALGGPILASAPRIVATIHPKTAQYSMTLGTLLRGQGAGRHAGLGAEPAASHLAAQLRLAQRAH